MTPDTRFVYGASCAWFGPIAEVGTTKPRHGTPGPGGLPCCPRCGGMLFEMDSAAAFWRVAEDHERAGHPGYVEMVRWADGQMRAGHHFKDYAHTAEAYRRRTGKDVRA